LRLLSSSHHNSELLRLVERWGFLAAGSIEHETDGPSPLIERHDQSPLER
jgi:hypothetical protein